ncbi:hypothetical protein AX768_07000 [Burkholderia sp. PAMC 28687]|uniref:hypothetical protein n=1 Tax=Burkholderia sp. PAMC 28687 TaxID=1795874 RepID=UPI000782F767|nr:hypothetical protein [Burkholderia sp. PAMC 28687]AMM13885.1 hypothetical protein AX768_07000 [Burkholderia sp. PAMC 28687]
MAKKKTPRESPLEILAASQAQWKADEAELAASKAEADAAAAQEELYDSYSAREVDNATALDHFRRRKAVGSKRRVPSPERKVGVDIAQRLKVIDDAYEHADKSRVEALRVQAVADNPKQVLAKEAEKAAIRQGVKASVETVPMPVRLEVEQVRMLKLLASYEQTTASAIIRASIKERLEQARQRNPGFDAAVRSSIEK